MPTAIDAPKSRILSLQAVLRMVPLSRTSLWRLERKGKFPKRVQVSENRIGWLEKDIEAWIQSKTDA